MELIAPVCPISAYSHYPFRIFHILTSPLSIWCDDEAILYVAKFKANIGYTRVKSAKMLPNY